MIEASPALSADAASSSPPSPPMADIQGVKVEMLDTCVRVELAPGRFKLLSYEDFLVTLSGNMSTKKENVTLEMYLPDNVFYFSQTATTIKISCYYPEQVVPLRFLSETEGVPRLLPNMIISFLLEKNSSAGSNAYRLSSEHVFYLCTKFSRMELPRKFYSGPVAKETNLLPVSNLYDNARMCYGGNARIGDFKLPDLRPLVSYYLTLVNSPFNTDLGVRAVQGAFSTEQWFREMARLAKAKEPFPYKVVGL